MSNCTAWSIATAHASCPSVQDVSHRYSQAFPQKPSIPETSSSPGHANLAEGFGIARGTGSCHAHWRLQPPWQHLSGSTARPRLFRPQEISQRRCSPKGADQGGRCGERRSGVQVAFLQLTPHPHRASPDQARPRIHVFQSAQSHPTRECMPAGSAPLTACAALR